MSKIIIPKLLLVAALATAKRCVTKSSLPILSQVKLEVAHGQLALTCTNLDQEIFVQVPCKSEAKKGALAGCVKASVLHDIVKALPELDAMCEVALEFGDRELTVSSHDSQYVLGLLPADEFPPSQRMDDSGVSFGISQGKLRSLLSSTSPAISEDESRYVLCSALLELKDDLKVVTTDGRRLAIADASTPGRAVKSSLLLPRFAVGELLGLLSADEEHSVGVEVLTNVARFTVADRHPLLTLRFTTKLLEGTYPNYQQVLTAPEFSVTTSRAELLAAVDRVAIIADKVTLTLNKSHLVLTGRNREKELPATASELLVCSGAPKKLAMSMNVDYLRDALSAVDAAEVQLNYTDGLSALLVTVPEGHWQMFIMPMRSEAGPAGDVAEAEDAGQAGDAAKAEDAGPASDAPEPDEQQQKPVEKPGRAKKPKKAKDVAPSESELTPEEENKVQQAIKAISENGKASLSLLQRWLGLSYAEACQIMDVLEDRAIVGPVIEKGAKAGTREVLITLPK